MASARIGDVLEISTPPGFAYVQYVNEHASMGSLIRVLPGIYEQQPKLEELIAVPELYFTFYNVQLALKKKLTRIVLHERAPASSKEFPLMRFHGETNSDGQTLTWLIGCGAEQFTLENIRTMRKVKSLSAEEERLSIYALWSHEVLVRRIVQGWRPELAEKFRQKAAASSRPPLESGVQSVTHYLYFSNKRDAEKAASRIRKVGRQAAVRLAQDEERWLVVAQQVAGESIETLREQLEKIAEELHGEYDGWAAAAPLLQQEDN